MKYWKVCYPEEVNDPDAWCVALEQTAYGAAIAHFKYLCERDPTLDETDLTVWPEAGGRARTFRVRAARVLTFSAEEMEMVDA